MESDNGYTYPRQQNYILPLQQLKWLLGYNVPEVISGGLIRICDMKLLAVDRDNISDRKIA